MKLKMIHAGYYEGHEEVDGYEVRLEVNTMDKQSFSFDIYVNDSFIYGDGWIGLRLKDIKQTLSSQIEDAIADYKSERNIK